MKNTTIGILAAVFIALSLSCAPSQQNLKVWNNKQCAVVLTYDDAVDIDLDNVIPALDSANLKGTFYIIGSSPVVDKRMPEWRKAAKNGHELGNHALFHPCDGSKPDRPWVSPDHDLSKYTVGRAVDEIRMNNVLLKAIDGKDKRTFAFPCGELKAGGEFFYNKLKNDFVAARGVNFGLQNAADVDLDNVNCYFVSNDTGEHLINLVKQARASHTLLVFLFHGVGGGHSISTSLDSHQKLVHYLKANEKDIWTAPLVTVAESIRVSKTSK